MKEVTMRQINRESVSVCMASYNGAFYIKQQIEAILPQLGQEDELIIVDDCSVDDTIEVILSIPDSRIHDNNVTKSHRGLGKKLYSRILFARAMGELMIRIIKYRIKQGDE